MRTILPLTLAMAFTLIGHAAFAQITITKADYPVVLGEDPFTVDVNKGTKLPEEGADKTYDYSSLKISSEEEETYYDATDIKAFPEATVFTNVDMTVAGFDFRTRHYTATTDDGHYEVGRTQFDSTHSLLMVTGNAADEMHFPTADLPYPNHKSFLKFPATYKDSWEETQIETTQFDLTVAAFGLNKTPGEVRRRRITTREVVGYGKLTLPGKDAKPSKSIDVLLLKYFETRIDSVFLGGAPAPPALLAAFQFTQGNTSTYRVYIFETKGFGLQPLFINYDEGGNAEKATYRPRTADVVNSISSIEHNLEVYPNRVREGQLITVKLGQNETLDNLRLLSMQGTEIPMVKMDNNQFLIPMGIKPGLYVYEARNTTETKVAVGKIIVCQ